MDHFGRKTVADGKVAVGRMIMTIICRVTLTPMLSPIWLKTLLLTLWPLIAVTVDLIAGMIQVIIIVMIRFLMIN